MITSEEEEDDYDQFKDIHNQFKDIQSDWNSIKKCSLHCSDRRSTRLLMDDISPRKLNSSYQQNPSPSNGWRVRTNDLAIEELVRERREAIESGRLQGRRLFESLEGECEEERCSASSSVPLPVHGSEVRSLSCYPSSPDDGQVENEDDNFLKRKNGDDHKIDGIYDGSCCRMEEEEKVGVVCVEKKCGSRVDVGDGRSWMSRISWIAYGLVGVVFALVIILILGTTLDEKQEGERLIPT